MCVYIYPHKYIRWVREIFLCERLIQIYIEREWKRVIQREIYLSSLPLIYTNTTGPMALWLVFANGPGGRCSIIGWIIPKTLKMVLEVSLLNNLPWWVLYYAKWLNPGKELAPSPTPRCNSWWKWSLRVALEYGRPATHTHTHTHTHIYIYIYIYI